MIVLYAFMIFCSSVYMMSPWRAYVAQSSTWLKYFSTIWLKDQGGVHFRLVVAEILVDDAAACVSHVDDDVAGCDVGESIDGILEGLDVVRVGCSNQLFLQGVVG